MYRQMDRETETSPLIRTFTSTPRRRNICRRIPSEVAITGIILGLFLLVVTLLIVLENLGSSSKEELSLDSNLLGSPYHSKTKDKSSKDKKDDESSQEDGFKELDKVNNWLDEWRKSYLVELSQQSPDATNKPLTEAELDVFLQTFREMLQNAAKKEGASDNLLGSPLSFNKKALDTTWQDKKASFIKDPKSKKWDNVDKGWKKINVLGSPFSYNKKAFDTTWQDKKAIFIKDPFNKKWDNVDKGWKKINVLGSPFMVDREKLDEVSENADKKMESMMYDTSDIGSPFMIDIEDYDQYREKLFEDMGGISLSSAKKEDPEKSPLGNALLKKLQLLYDEWEKAKTMLKSEAKLNKKELEKFISENSFSNRSVAAPTGCPFAETDNLQLKSAAIPPETLVSCAHLVEDIRRTLGKCIDMSFLPKECKPSWKNKCFSTYNYRKIDGTCNNQIHPTWGKSSTPYVRMIAPDYSDGVSKIRTALGGGELPNARLLSQKLYSKKIKPDIDVTLLLLSFGLMVDHDMVETAINSDGIPCCDSKFEAYPMSIPRECLQIYVPKDDSFYGPRNVKCLNFVRSIPTHGECLGRREQLNKATSFLDASAVYGSTVSKSKTLRSFSKGQLRSQHINNTPYMPNSDGTGYNCGTPTEPLKCFAAGDSRVNMLVELTAMHTLWYREHNRLAEELHKLNPQWTDELLFQEARRILIAELQHITYNEFLPLLLGEAAISFFQLNIEPNEYYNGYDDTIDPSVFNVFGAAAFRFGHSLMKDKIDLVGPNNKTEGRVPLHTTFFNPQLLYHNGLDLLLRGATKQKLHSVDSFITDEIREHLFQSPDRDFGHDLAAVGIQRGRDHGLPSYTKWRSACDLPDINTWEDLYAVMNPERANMLKQVYKSVADIDLIPGALAEDHIAGSLLGPTYLCILGRQFKKTRMGDRFWFEMQDKIGAFTKDQLQEIYNSSMARIICDNSDKIQTIQRLPFKVASLDNSILHCQDIPKLDLSKWIARPIF